MTKNSKARDFLQNMKLVADEPTPTAPVNIRDSKKKTATRDGLKHIGGYFEMDTVEKVAILRARLRLDNSELIKLAIDELHKMHSAKRAFGDA